jgi:hypothetical protein
VPGARDASHGSVVSHFVNLTPGLTNVATVRVPNFLKSFIDDGSLFPPGNVPLEQAVLDHADHRAEEYADLVGGFVVSDTKIADLAPLVATGPVEVNVVVTGGAGAIAPAVTWVTRAAGLSLRALEFALRDEEDLAHNARRLVSVVDSLAEELEGVVVYAGPPTRVGPPSAGWLSALDELAAREIHLKLRDIDATAIEAALDRELPFKCVGAVDGRFVQVLAGTRASLDGATTAEVQEVLDQENPSELAKGLLDDPDRAARTRRWFESFSAASVLEVHEDLVELGLL